MGLKRRLDPQMAQIIWSSDRICPSPSTFGVLSGPNLGFPALSSADDRLTVSDVKHVPQRIGFSFKGAVRAVAAW